VRKNVCTTGIKYEASKFKIHFISINNLEQNGSTALKNNFDVFMAGLS